MNKVFLIGRLTREPELRYTESNIPVCKFGIAVNRTYTNQSGEREADFINVTVWRKQAENVDKYLSKGSQVAIDGKIQVTTYEKDGVKRNNVEVVADNVQFLDTKNESTINENFAVERIESHSEDPFAEMGEIVSNENPFDNDDFPF